MTPQEKAKELVWKYYYQIENIMSNEYSDKCWKLSKQCALIAVDEIIEANPISFDEQDNCIAKQWWQEVKTEIEKL